MQELIEKMQKAIKEYDSLKRRYAKADNKERKYLKEEIAKLKGAMNRTHKRNVQQLRQYQIYYATLDRNSAEYTWAVQYKNHLKEEISIYRVWLSKEGIEYE